MNANFWTESERQSLRDLRAQGHTFRVIGKMIGRPRNSCIGQARRLGIPTPTVAITRQDHFDDVLADTGSVQKASLAAGYSLDDGMSRFYKVCRELGRQAR